MTIGDKIIELSEGNPGCAHALGNLVKENLMLGMFIVSKMDELKLRGTNIYVLFNDICEYNYNLLEYIVKFTNPEKLFDACNRQDRSGKIILRDELQEWFTRDFEQDVNAQARDDVY
jgi:hypothetical protein